PLSMLLLLVADIESVTIGRRCNGDSEVPDLVRILGVLCALAPESFLAHQLLLFIAVTGMMSDVLIWRRDYRSLKMSHVHFVLIFCGPVEPNLDLRMPVEPSLIVPLRGPSQFRSAITGRHYAELVLSSIEHPGQVPRVPLHDPPLRL